MIVVAIVMCAFLCWLGSIFIRSSVDIYKSEDERNKGRSDRKLENRLNKLYVVMLVIGGLAFTGLGIFILIQGFSA